MNRIVCALLVLALTGSWDISHASGQMTLPSGGTPLTGRGLPPNTLGPAHTPQSPQAPHSPAVSTTNVAPTPSNSRVEWQVVGRSYEERVIECAQFGKGQHHVLVIGSLVGNLPEGNAVAEQLAEHLARFPRRLGDVTVTIVRNPNPDGHARRTAGNAQGVMLDRNFLTSAWRQWHESQRLTSGQSPESEMETRVLTQLLSDVRPHRVIMLTTAEGATTLRYTGPAEHLARQVAVEARAKLIDADPAYGSGSFDRLTGVDRGIPTLVMGFVPHAMADVIFSNHKAALMTAIGCGTPMEFVAVGGARPAPHPAATPFTRPMQPIGNQSAEVAGNPAVVNPTPVLLEDLQRGLPLVKLQPVAGGSSPGVTVEQYVLEPQSPNGAAQPTGIAQPNGTGLPGGLRAEPGTPANTISAPISREPTMNRPPTGQGFQSPLQRHQPAPPLMLPQPPIPFDPEAE